VAETSNVVKGAVAIGGGLVAFAALRRFSSVRAQQAAAAKAMLGAVAAGQSPVATIRSRISGKSLASVSSRSASLVSSLVFQSATDRSVIFGASRKAKVQAKSSEGVRRLQKQQSMLLKASARLGAEGLKSNRAAINSITQELRSGYFLANGELILFSGSRSDHPGWLGSLLTFGYRCQAFQEEYLRRKGHMIVRESFPKFGQTSYKNNKTPFLFKFAPWPMPFQMSGPEATFYQGRGAITSSMKKYKKALQINALRETSGTSSSNNLKFGMDLNDWIFRWSTSMSLVKVTDNPGNPYAVPLAPRAYETLAQFGLIGNVQPKLYGKEILNPRDIKLYSGSSGRLTDDAIKYREDYALYMLRSRWLIVAAEWWRVLSMGTRYQSAPKKWATHCSRWGIGVVNRGRFDSKEIPDIASPPTTISVSDLLDNVIAFTPPPGTFVDKDGNSIVHQVQPPCWDWPEDLLGALTPNSSLPSDFMHDVALRNWSWAADEEEKFSQRIMIGFEAIKAIISLGTSGADLATTIFDIAEVAIDVSQQFGLNLGPIVSILGIARQYSDLNWGGNPAALLRDVSDELDQYIGKGMETVYQAEAFMSKMAAINGLTEIIESVRGWDYCEDLYGTAVDVASDPGGWAKKELSKRI